jgi:SsrA-binding protein
MSGSEPSGRVAANRRAWHDYEVLERIEAGLALKGTEVKSLRLGHASLAGSHCRVDGVRAWALGFTIPVYECGNRFNHDPERPKQLLLHASEIRKLAAHAGQQGHALVPLAVYFHKGRAKLEIGVCRGKSRGDKRETLKRREADLESRRAASESRRAS